jgi:menaquinol-cytochrome c reductase cytochrome b/c subunit
MAHGHDPNEKVIYVGDSRIRKKTSRPDPRDYSAYPGKSEVFIPNFLLKEWMVAVVVLVGILVLVMSDPAPLGYPADPKANIIPMPDWYFLFLYQFLKYPYTSDQYIVFGTLLVPGIAFGALLLAPFLDTGKERRFYRRPIASGLMILALASCTYLTWVAWDHYQKELAETGTVPDHIKREEERKAGNTEAPKPQGKQVLPAIVAADDPAAEIYKKATCVSCHAADLKGQSGIPPLRGIGDKHNKDEILNIIKNGQGGMSPQYEANKSAGLSDDDIDKLSDWLAKQKKGE